MKNTHVRIVRRKGDGFIRHRIQRMVECYIETYLLRKNSPAVLAEAQP